VIAEETNCAGLVSTVATGFAHNLLETEYPSEPLSLEKKLGVKTYLSVSIPDTPYGFYILNGQVSPYFIDTEKEVIWHVKSSHVESSLHDMRTISTSSRRVVFSAPRGDMAAFFVVVQPRFRNTPIADESTKVVTGGLLGAFVGLAPRGLIGPAFDPSIRS